MLVVVKKMLLLKTMLLPLKSNKVLSLVTKNCVLLIKKIYLFVSYLQEESVPFVPEMLRSGNLKLFISQASV